MNFNPTNLADDDVWSADRASKDAKREKLRQVKGLTTKDYITGGVAGLAAGLVIGFLWKKFRG